MADYHEIRESLMHSNGTSGPETFLAVIPSFFHTFLTTTLTSLLMSFMAFNNKKRFLLEFTILIVPLVLYMTILSNYMIPILLCLIILSIVLVVIIKYSNRTRKKIIIDKSQNDFITNARSTINVLSVIAILAVDFRIFPRNNTKTITYGYSLMDLGVGLYIFSNGIVAPEVASNDDPVAKTFMSSLPLLVLGLMRALLVKEIDYHVPVSEYGIHWNFFITLAVTKIFTSLIMRTVKIKYLYINALLLIVSHEVMLQAGLADLVLKDTKRDSFLLANKEGLVSCLGYICIYLMSVYCGYVLGLKHIYIRKRLRLKTSLKFLLICGITLSASLILKNYFGISRRLANSAYCFWVLFIGIFMTGLFYVAELSQRFIFREKLIHSILTPFIFEAVNYNGLAFFLISNLLTGLINVFCDTLEVSYIMSVVIISFYMLINCGMMCFLFVREKKLKLR